MLFKKGKIEMSLGKYNFVPGETITGNINLSMKKPVTARGLTVQLRGDLITKRMSRDSDGHMKSETNRTCIFDQKIPLDGEKKYKDSNYNFEIKIPENILDEDRPLEGALGSAVKAMKFITGTRERIEWQIIAKLDVPKALDVSKKQQITIG